MSGILTESIIENQEEVKKLNEKISSLNMDLERQEQKYKEILLKKCNKIKTLKKIIKQKEEELKQKDEIIIKNKNFNMVKNYESKLKIAEDKINKLNKHNMYYRSARALSKDKFKSKIMQKEISQFGLDREKKQKKSKKTIQSSIQNINEIILEENLKEDIINEEEQSRKEGNKIEDLSFLIKEMQNKIEEKDIHHEKTKEQFDYYKKKFENALKEKNEIGERLDRIEQLNYKLMEEIDEMREKQEIIEIINNNLTDENNRYKKKMNEHSNTNEDLSININEYSVKMTSLINENELLKEEYEFLEKTLLKKEEHFNEKLRIGQNQLNEKDGQISELKTKLQDLIEKNTEFIKNLEKDHDHVELIEEHYKYKFEEFEKIHHNKIKELENQINYFRDEVDKLKKSKLHFSTHLDSDIHNSNLGGLDYEDMNEDHIHDINSLNIKNTDDNYGLDTSFPKSDEDKDIFYYVNELNEKTHEIQNLRQQLIEATENENTSFLKDEIMTLKLKIKHLNETIENITECYKKEKHLLKENYENMTFQYMVVKLKLTDISCEKDNLIIAFNRKLKRLKYQIQIYEDQINKFNKIMHDNHLAF